MKTIIIGIFSFFSLSISFSCLANEKLFQAIRENNFEKVSDLFEANQQIGQQQKIDVNIRNQAGLTPLLIACKEMTDPKIIRLLIQKGADVNVRDEYQYTPLMLAIKSHQFRAIKEILSSQDLEKHIYPTTIHNIVNLAQPSDFNDPFALQNMRDFHDRVYSRSKDYDRKKEEDLGQKAPLFLAIELLDKPSVLELLNEFPIRNNEDRDWLNTFFMAALFNFDGDLELISAFIKKGADAIFTLNGAFQHGRMDLVYSILQNENLDFKNYKWVQCLQHFLFLKTINPNLLGIPDGPTDKQVDHVISKLMSKGVSIRSHGRDENKRPTFMMFFKNSDDKFFDQLIKDFLDSKDIRKQINRKSKKDKTVLHYALKHGFSPDIIERIAKSGADFTPTNRETLLNHLESRKYSEYTDAQLSEFVANLLEEGVKLDFSRFEEPQAQVPQAQIVPNRARMRNIAKNAFSILENRHRLRCNVLNQMKGFSAERELSGIVDLISSYLKP